MILIFSQMIFALKVSTDAMTVRYCSHLWVNRTANKMTLHEKNRYDKIGIERRQQYDLQNLSMQ